MHTHIDDYIKAIEEMGYTHEEAKKFVEQAAQPVDISCMDEEFQRFVDEFNSIGCTSFQLTPEEIKEILERQENA